MSEQPHHLAIIMDGNRRWARERRLNVLRGHNRGADTLKDICSYAYDLGQVADRVRLFRAELVAAEK